MSRKIKGFPLPEQIDGHELKYLCIPMPDEPSYRQAFWGHLLYLCNWFAWEHGQRGDTRAKRAAEYWRSFLLPAYHEYLDGEGECSSVGIEGVRQRPDSPCVLDYKDGGTWHQFADLRLCPPLLRQGGDGKIEYSTDGGETWEDVPDAPGTSDPLYTNPPAPRGDNGACERAVNAMRVYSYFAQELANIIDNTPGGILPLIAARYARLFYDFWNSVFAGDLDAASSATALNLEILNYLTALFLDATAAGQSAGTYLRESWDGFTQDDVICAFYCAQNPDGTLNYDQAQSKLLELVNADEIRATVKALVDCFGEGGFAAAQSVEGTVDRDCDDCECGQVLLESQGFPGGYGTLTYLGSGRWRVESESRGSDHAIGVRRAGSLCWYSSNYTFVSGSSTYQDYRLCGGGSQTIGNPANKCITSFFMAGNAPFTLEFDASECP